jgi:outer membrane biosynthesis protein TonB
MSAATEFMIGHSADDAVERKQELRKVAWALLAALLLHLLVGSFFAAFSGWFSPSSPLEDDRPVELTIVEMPPPAPKVEPKRNAMFHETDPAKQTVEQPKEKTFESNANSQAASELPAAGSMPIPTQQGVDRPTTDLETHQATLAAAGAAPQPTVRPQEKPTPSVAPSAAPTPTPADQLAMLRATPTPAVQPSATPEQVRSTYQPLKQQKRMTGAISNRGASSVNAVGTPLGRYQKMLYDAVGSRWYSYVQQQSDLVSIGTAHVVFSVDRSGRVRNLKIVQNTSNESFANVCLRSVLEVQLPPIPDDVAATLPSEGLEEEMSFTMYAN